MLPQTQNSNKNAQNSEKHARQLLPKSRRKRKGRRGSWKGKEHIDTEHALMKK